MADTPSERKRSPKTANDNASTKSSFGSRAGSASPSPAGVARRPAPPSRTRMPISNSKSSSSTNINKDPSFEDLAAQGDAEDPEVYARSSREALIAALTRLKAEHAEVCRGELFPLKSLCSSYLLSLIGFSTETITDSPAKRRKLTQAEENEEMMNRIPMLPLELKSMIVEALQQDCKQVLGAEHFTVEYHDLFNIARVSQHWLHATRPILYRSLDLSNLGANQLRALLTNTLCLHGRHVRSVAVAVTADGKYPNWFFPHPDVATHFERNHITAGIMCLLPNVKACELRMTGGQINPPRWLGILLALKCMHPEKLSIVLWTEKWASICSQRTVTPFQQGVLSLLDKLDPLDAAQVAAIIKQCPTAREIRIANTTGYYTQTLGACLAAHQYVRRLQLDRVPLPSAAPLASLPTALTSLHLQNNFKHTAVDILAILQATEATLETLHIQNYGCETSPAVQRALQSITAQPKLSKLKTVIALNLRCLDSSFLKAFMHCKRLSALSIGACPLTGIELAGVLQEGAFETTISIDYWPALEMLEIEGGLEIAEQHWKRLEEACATREISLNRWHVVRKA